MAKKATKKSGASRGQTRKSSKARSSGARKTSVLRAEETLSGRVEPAREFKAPSPWKLLGKVNCRSCGARYRVTEAPLSEVIRGWYRCGVCARTLDSWDGPKARAYTPV